MFSDRRPPLAGRIAAAMCLIVCLTIMALNLLLGYLGSDGVGYSFVIMIGVAATCGWLSIAPPQRTPLAFIPAVVALGYAIFAMLAKANMTADRLLAFGLREAADRYTSALALLLVGLAVLTRRSRAGAKLPEGIMVYSVLDKTANIRELRVATAAFVSAAMLYLAAAAMMPLGGLPLLEKLAVGLALCMGGAAIQELFGYILLRPETFIRLLEESQPVSSALRMAGWLVCSFIAGVTVASMVVLTVSSLGYPFAVYTWIGAGGWFGVARWIYGEFVRMRIRETTSKMLRGLQAA